MHRPHAVIKLLRSLGRIVLAFACLALTYLLFALILGLIPVNADFIQPEKGIDIYVSTNGAHADLMVPTRNEYMDWFKLFPPEQFGKVDTSFKYISFGWGERNFYLNTPTWDDLTFDVAVHALFWPSRAAMHVDLSRTLPAGDDIVRIRISHQQYIELIEHLQGDFKRDSGNMPILIEGGSYWDADNFYEAHGRYHLFRTSNTWTSRGLKKIGVRTAVWSPFDRAVMYHARRIN